MQEFCNNWKGMVPMERAALTVKDWLQFTLDHLLREQRLILWRVLSLRLAVVRRKKRLVYQNRVGGDFMGERD